MKKDFVISSEKTMLLVLSWEDAFFKPLLRYLERDYSIVCYKSGVEALRAAQVEEPNFLLAYGLFLEDMDAVALMYKVMEAFPDRKMRLVFFHNGRYQAGYPDTIQWGYRGIDVTLPKGNPGNLLFPILEKLKEPYPVPPPEAP